jgi:hypothetical protein
MRNKRDPGAWGSSLTKSGVEFVELDGRTETTHHRLPGVANDGRKDVGVEEITDEDQLEPIRQDVGGQERIHKNHLVVVMWTNQRMDWGVWRRGMTSN